MSKAYAEARAEHGESELLDEIVSAKPKMDHARYHLQGVNHGAECSGLITAWW